MSLSSLRTLVRAIKQNIRAFWMSLQSTVIADEDIKASKQKWNRLAQENAKYYVYTDYGEHITEEEFRAAGQRDYEDLVADDALLREHLSDFNTKSVLEVGCGTGRITEFFADHFARVCGVDISDRGIEECRQRVAGKNNVQVCATDGMQYPFPNAAFDLVFSSIVFQHMPSKEIIRSNMEQVARVLKPTGIAKIQLRGIPVSKDKWFYGPSFSSEEARALVAGLPLRIVKEEGIGERYYWLWLTKEQQ